MMSDPENKVGEIEISFHTAASVLWKIPNYFSLSQKADSLYESPVFHFSGSTWSLLIYPNGSRSNNSVEFVGLYLKHLTLGKSHSVTVDFSIICGNGEVKKKCYECSFNGDKISGLGLPKHIERVYLLRNKDEIAPQGTLTIKFVGISLLRGTDVATQTRTVDGVDALVRDFQILFNTEQKTDVAIQVQNRVFRAHKIILEARSTVFAAMFEHDMKEKNTGVVNIVDCDPSAFQHFLSFVYTGKIDNLTSDSAIGLFSLANKYDLSELKEICCDFIKENLCLDTVCDVLAIADEFDEVELINSAKTLLLKNIKSVTSTAKWIQFTRENPLMATEILVTAIPTERS